MLSATGAFGSCGAPCARARKSMSAAPARPATTARRVGFTSMDVSSLAELFIDPKTFSPSAACGLPRGCRRRNARRQARRFAPVRGEVPGIIRAQNLDRAEEAAQMAAHRRQRAIAVTMNQAIDDEAVLDDHRGPLAHDAHRQMADAVHLRLGVLDLAP